MKITITIKKEELDALKYWSSCNHIQAKPIKQLLEKIEKQTKYSKEQKAYNKKVKDIMGGVVDAIEKHKFVI